MMMQEIDRRCGKMERLGSMKYPARPMEFLEKDDWFFGAQVSPAIRL